MPIAQKKHRLTGLLLLLASFAALSAWYMQELAIREQFSYAGIPKATSYSLNSFTRIFRNQGFMLGYSEIRQNPLWVTYRLGSSRKLKVGKRPKNFRIDQRTLARVTPRDYSRSGYNRGHLAPNYAIAKQFGREAQLDTFLMSNITPQRPLLNQKLWQRLEEVEIDYFTRWFGTIWIITGPVFDREITRLESGVEIPDAFYKIFVIPAQTPRVLAFIVPQQVQGPEPLDEFLVSVDEVEQRTGLDFLHQLEDALEEKLESSVNPSHWRLKEVARLPPRY